MTNLISIEDGARRADSVRPTPGRGLRLALAVVAPMSALAIAATDLYAPYQDGDSARTVLDAVASNPGAVNAMSWAWLVVALTLVPGVIAAGLASLRGAPRLATAGLLISVPAWGAGLAFPDVAGIARALVEAGTTGAEGLALLDHVMTTQTPTQAAAVLLFVVGHIVGTVLLGIAMIRSRAVPMVFGILLAVSQPLHFVAFVILGSVWLDAVAYLLTAIGFAAGGIAYYRQARG